MTERLRTTNICAGLSLGILLAGATLPAVFMIQSMGGAGGPGMTGELETLVYQAIVE